MPRPTARRKLYRDASRAAWIGLLVNLLLGVVKLIAGLLTQAYALIADSVNSLGDSVTSIVVLFALRVAQRPADAEHPYGHTRAEAVAASNVALLLIISALVVGWHAIEHFRTEHPLPPIWAVSIAAVNVVIKESLYWYKIRVGRRTGSRALIANAWDHRSDALCSLAVLVGLLTVRVGGPQYLWADETAALIVVGAILFSGVQLFRRGASELMDEHADEALVARVQAAASSVGEVREIETLWVRKSGLEHFVDIHVEVDPELTVAAGHEIAHRVKDRILAEVHTVRDVLVHIEPSGQRSSTGRG
ncbi:MAG: cation transporter [Acidobacteriota bacterium]|nr:MAG: cation transporter [Acidobacteriota bacterium]